MRILLIKVSSLGDVVHAMPVVRDILAAHPQARIDWVVEEGFVDLVSLVRGVDGIIPFALRRWRKTPFSARTRSEFMAFRARLRRERYDCVIDAQGLVKTALIGAMARGPVAGLGNRTEGSGYEPLAKLFYDRCIRIEPHIHVITRGRELAARALGYALPETLDFGMRAEPLPEFTGPDMPPYVALVHATSRADKGWPADHWIALGAELAAAGYRLVLPWGGAAEKEAAQALADGLAAKGARAEVLPKMNLRHIAGLLAGAAAVVGVDTGLIHMAAALDRPTVELYNFDTAWRTGGFWSARVVNLGGAGRTPSVSEVRGSLRGLGLLA
ncbi:MAG: lipopolysaccharide heptosyltransferase I [Candidatus Protistobacter heckmanni]|nr:lipopolysaccharide heptosyltransferase I [Candidatus Protistobacter heckmanni]